LICSTAKSLIDVPATLTSVTRNTPISSAFDVVAVRFGLRDVLSAARRPSSPNRSSTGRSRRLPTTAITGPAITTPTNSANAATPRRRPLA
jgi:hypothetical protein